MKVQVTDPPMTFAISGPEESGDTIRAIMRYGDSGELCFHAMTRPDAERFGAIFRAMANAFDNAAASGLMDEEL